jgi:hypothetical protein
MGSGTRPEIKTSAYEVIVQNEPSIIPKQEMMEIEEESIDPEWATGSHSIPPEWITSQRQAVVSQGKDILSSVHINRRKTISKRAHRAPPEMSQKF